MFFKNGAINGNSFYQNGDLVKTTSTDEDGNTVITYNGGKSGRVIQKIQTNRITAETLITAFVYDFGGRLVYTIPPKAYEAQTYYAANSPQIVQGLYQNQYDGQSRIIISTQPGGGFQENIYNELDQVLFTQDARQREEALNGYTVWEWVKYDGHGRLIMSGTKSLNVTPATIRGYFENFTVTEQFEERLNVPTSIFGYTNRSFPPELLITADDVKIVNYYDDYNWVGWHLKTYLNLRWIVLQE